MRGSILLAMLCVGCPGGASIDVGADSYHYDSGLFLVDSSEDSPREASSDSSDPIDLAPDQAPDHQAPDQAAPDSKLPGEIGDPCYRNTDCIYGVCAFNMHTGKRFCTKICDPCTIPCPTGSGCQNAGSAFICAPGYPNAPCQNP